MLSRILLINVHKMLRNTFKVVKSYVIKEGRFYFMRKRILKSTCIAMAIISSIAVVTGCNKKLDVKFDCNASDYVTIGEYKGITISLDQDAIIKGYVDGKVKSDLDTVTTYAAVNRVSQAEDQMTLSFTGTIAGETIDGFSSDSYSLVLGKDTFNVPGFVDVLTGLKAGDKKVVVLTVPDPFTDEPTYAGKRIVYDITVVTVEAPVIPQITDAYVQKNFSYATVAEYKAALQASMQDTIDKDITSKKKEAALLAIMDNAQVIGYPQDLLDAKKEELNKSISFYSTMYKMTVEEYCQSRYNVSLEDYAKKALEQSLILQEIIEKENLSVDEYYYKGNLAQFASDNGYTDADSFVTKYGKDFIVKNMLIQKAVDLVLDNVVNK